MSQDQHRCMGFSRARGLLTLVPLPFETSVGDWFNTYLGYLQYVSRCTNVWFMLMIVDVTIDVFA